MPLFIMLTRLTPTALKSPATLEEAEKSIKTKIRENCPEVKWVNNYAVMGPYDYVDIFKAPDVETAFKVSTIIRTFGHAQTEIWSATEWSDYKESVRNLAQG
ncbi:GYD domain-containing protein [Desulfopila inferna]|uniref:GYD domain-containing protein n=1 Tax=Desulfopila inferna TaxID=468528 RepID=UPI001962E9C3|nr:GYD domain-containing protein [Desulfopila inferna]MBM9603729.1 GYD domain-containing protein [Desulfopila inferna]